MEPKKESKKAVCDVKVKLIKLKGGTAAPPPVATDSAAGRKGVRSTTEGEIFKGTDGACADPDTQNFPCHGGSPPAQPSNFIQAAFTSHTGSLLLSSLKKVTSPLVPPRPPPLPINEHIHRRSRWLSLCGHSPPSCANALTRKYDLPAA